MRLTAADQLGVVNVPFGLSLSTVDGRTWASTSPNFVHPDAERSAHLLQFLIAESRADLVRIDRQIPAGAEPGAP
jgi:hypothetical protein